MTALEAEQEYNIRIPNKEFFERLTLSEQLDIINMKLKYHNKIADLFKEINNDK